MSKHARQYTIRNVPAEVDLALRRRAKLNGVSLNQAALEALAAGAGAELVQRRDLSDVIGSMTTAEAARMDDEVRRQRVVDPELWH